MAYSALSFKTIRSRISRYSGAFFLSLAAGGSRRASCPVKPESICILAQEKLGDAILLVPLFKGLKRIFPDIRITVIASRNNESFFRLLPMIHEVYTPKRNDISLKTFVRKHRFDILYNPKDHPSRSYLFMTTLIHARCKVGFNHVFGHRFYDILLDRGALPVIELNLRLLSLFDGGRSQPTMEPRDLPISHAGDAERFFRSVHKPVMGLNLSAGSPAREWSMERWEELIKGTSPERATFFLFGMKVKSDGIQDLTSRYPNVISRHPLGDISEVHAYMRHLDGFITPDTSLLHIALINDIPTVGLFTNNMANVERFYRPTGSSVIIISRTSRVDDIDPDDVNIHLDGILRRVSGEADLPQ